MSDVTLTLQKRGEEAAKNLLANSIVPGVIYGKGKESISFQADYETLRKHIRKHQLHIPFYVELDGKKYHAIVKSYDRHPVKDTLCHVDMYILDDKHEVTVPVPVEFVGTSDVLRSSVLTVALDALPITCLPSKIPSVLTIDLKILTPGNTKITLDQVSLPENTACHLAANSMIAKAAMVRGLAELAKAQDAVAAANSL